MTKIRRFAAVFSVSALLVPMVSCASSRSIDVTHSHLLTCESPPDTTAEQKQIGRAGGFLRAGGNSAVIPGMSVPARANFTLASLDSTLVAVSFTGLPAGQVFKREATVFISIARCTPTEVGDTARLRVLRLPNLNASKGDTLTTGWDGDVVWAYTDKNSVFVILAD